jgi:hypothetical protein
VKRSFYIVLLFVISNSQVYAQYGWSLGFDIGKSVILNSMLYKNQELARRTHFHHYYPKNSILKQTSWFPNIANLAIVLNYQRNEEYFLRLKMAKTINYLILSRYHTSTDFVFPSRSTGNEYIQSISYFSISYNKQKRIKKNFFALGIGTHLSIYKKDEIGKQIYNIGIESYEEQAYVRGNDSTIVISETQIFQGKGKLKPLPGINFNAEYSLQFKKAGRLSFYANAYINLASSNFFFSVTHQVTKYDRQAQQLIVAHPQEKHVYRFTNNPLQFGIIYYLPAFVLNKRMQLKQ